MGLPLYLETKEPIGKHHQRALKHQGPWNPEEAHLIPEGSGGIQRLST